MGLLLYYLIFKPNKLRHKNMFELTDDIDNDNKQIKFPTATSVASVFNQLLEKLPTEEKHSKR